MYCIKIQYGALAIVSIYQGHWRRGRCRGCGGDEADDDGNARYAYSQVTFRINLI